MFIKLGIIVGIVVLGGMVFSNEIDNLFPTTSASVLDSLKNDVSEIGEKASNSVEQRLDESVDKIVDKTGDAITNEINEAGESIKNEISEVKDSSQKAINEEITNFNPIESITNFIGGNSKSQTPKSYSPSSSESNSSTQTPLVYETLSLATKQQSDDNILLQYSDSSGKTQSVNVVMRSDQKEIFSGTFYSSMFETTVNDAAGIPYYIDMIVEHEDYGTVTSSVFNPGDSTDSKINGIFSQ